MRSNIGRYYMNNYRNWGRISIRCWIHKKHPIACPNGRAMGCLLWIFVRKIDCVITAPHCTCIVCVHLYDCCKCLRHTSFLIPIWGESHRDWTHWSLNKMAHSLQTTFSNAFSWKKKFSIVIQIWLKLVPEDPVVNKLALVQAMVWWWTDGKCMWKCCLKIFNNFVQGPFDQHGLT